MHEQKEKAQEEKVEQRRIREEMREEEKVRREAEKAEKEAVAEEGRYEKTLLKAQEELGQAHGNALDKLQQEIQELQEKIKLAEEKKQRAISRAQMTKSGNVYVISNVGSFGENVYKIGMTRRLEPMDRVKELGDASVPFSFDVHAMIFSENAPQMEAKLHAKFKGKQVNMVNYRKEFFRVSLEEIESEVHKHDGHIDFMKLAEAKEYRETKALLQSQLNQATTKLVVEDEFPASL